VYTKCTNQRHINQGIPHRKVKCSFLFFTYYKYIYDFCYNLYWQETSCKKSRAVPLHAMETHGERRYSSYSYLILALDGGEWSASRPDRTLPLGKEPLVPIGQEAGWAPEPVWTQRLEEKSSASARDRTPVVQSIVSHYTDWATPAPKKLLVLTWMKGFSIIYDLSSQWKVIARSLTGFEGDMFSSVIWILNVGPNPKTWNKRCINIMWTYITIWVTLLQLQKRT
jgi:hypothetical protein